MFERYNDDARQALFFARKAVSEHGGSQVEPEHLVIGVLRAQPQVILRFASANVGVDHMCQRLAAVVEDTTRLPDSHEVRFSTDSVAALQRAQLEADDLSDVTIRPEHVILGILVKTASQAAAALSEAGVQISAIREYLSSQRGE
jgi:ATP-dependent Clp protease ATP-binding subunit ClpA